MKMEMNSRTLKRKRAETYEEIQPLINLCKLGKLFEVQKWIAEGRPIDPPLVTKNRRKSPLKLAMELGFHSLVQILLEGGAHLEDQQQELLALALEDRRLDLIELLVEFGADTNSFPMVLVLGKGDRKIIDFFIAQGGDLETENPLAAALCEHIYPILGVYKQYESQFPGLKEQANIALRHSCREGKLKWVSLMLWAGTDPYAKGPSSPDEDPDPESDCCALELAAIYDHPEIFKLKPIRTSLSVSNAEDFFHWACRSAKADLLIDLLEKGFKPGELPDRGSSLIQGLLERLYINFDYRFYSERPKWNIDGSDCRERIKMIHLLARNGAKWLPGEKEHFDQVRYSLRRLNPDYLLEFIWIMGGYQACSREVIKELIGTPNMKKLISGKREVVERLLKGLGEEKKLN
jgi:hypothetical protein